jgi:hypothetical protein
MSRWSAVDANAVLMSADVVAAMIAAAADSVAAAVTAIVAAVESLQTHTTLVHAVAGNSVKAAPCFVPSDAYSVSPGNLVAAE